MVIYGLRYQKLEVLNLNPSGLEAFMPRFEPLIGPYFLTDFVKYMKPYSIFTFIFSMIYFYCILLIALTHLTYFTLFNGSTIYSEISLFFLRVGLVMEWAHIYLSCVLVESRSLLAVHLESLDVKDQHFWQIAKSGIKLDFRFLLALFALVFVLGVELAHLKVPLQTLGKAALVSE